ncbi:hypothetical protein [Billgrantia tianxiuensis]|uniref:hypothetical protein n=1 Tax=Billgrantia tianxiuensis TaxID=2497861 RepID=UPI00135B8283|nr:hypothetical protein [Halomonas tianxiuensis]
MSITLAGSLTGERISWQIDTGADRRRAIPGRLTLAGAGERGGRGLAPADTQQVFQREGLFLVLADRVTFRVGRLLCYRLGQGQLAAITGQALDSAVPLFPLNLPDALARGVARDFLTLLS